VAVESLRDDAQQHRKLANGPDTSTRERHSA
jgi:hypothetical protein